MKQKIKDILFKIIHPSSTAVKIIIIPLGAAFIIVGFLGYFQPVVKFLDSPPFIFEVGKFKFSIYSLVEAIFIVIILFWTAHGISSFGDKRIKKIRNIRYSNRELLSKTLQIFIYLVAFLTMLEVLGIDLTAFAVAGGAIGIGIGFGLQKITSNFISGIILLFEKSVENNDLIELSDGTYGFIRKMGGRYILIETIDSKEILIPNEDFITNRVTNWTYSNTKGRISIEVGVSYKSDIHKAYQIILEAAKSHPRCIEDPYPRCFLKQFADNSVNFTLYFWVGAFLWVCMIKSGVHATLTGVVVGFALPLTSNNQNSLSPLMIIEHELQRWVPYFILPLFVLANAGVPLSDVSFAKLLEPLSLGIALGLAVGKPLGVSLFVLWAKRMDIISLPSDFDLKIFIATAMLTGIGFTMSLFIGTLAFEETLIMSIRIGVLTGSTIAAIAGCLLLAIAIKEPAKNI